MALAENHSRRQIQTAACLVIGDEVLGGKTVDTNSAYMAKWCFSLGISLKRIEVVEDDEGEIIEAVRRMSDRYDFIVTSGGIGPTHDDITYQSISKAFNLPLKLHKEAFERMKRMSRPHPSQPNFSFDNDTPAVRAKLRMVELPTDESKDLSQQVIFPQDDLWVPVTVVNGNVHILPGVPKLCQHPNPPSTEISGHTDDGAVTRLLDGLKPHLLSRLVDSGGNGITRILISTPLAESEVAAYLTQLAAEVEPKGVKVGSYPRWGKSRNTVTLVGRDREFLDGLVGEMEKKVQGKRVYIEGEDDDSGSERTKEA